MRSILRATLATVFVVAVTLDAQAPNVEQELNRAQDVLLDSVQRGDAAAYHASPPTTGQHRRRRRAVDDGTTAGTVPERRFSWSRSDRAGSATGLLQAVGLQRAHSRKHRRHDVAESPIGGRARRRHPGARVGQARRPVATVAHPDNAASGAIDDIDAAGR